MVKRILCHLCLKQVEIDSSKGDKEKHRISTMFKCCQTHLNAKIKGDSFEWCYSEEVPTPFCEGCFKLSENLWILEEQFRQAKKALDLYIITVTNEILRLRTAQQSKNIKNNNNETLHFLDDNVDISSTQLPAPDYFDELYEVVDEDVKVKQEELKDGYFNDYDTKVTHLSGLLDRDEDANQTRLKKLRDLKDDVSGHRIKINRELRVSLERLKFDSNGKVVHPHCKTWTRGLRKAAVTSNSAICIGSFGNTEDDFEDYEPDFRDDDFTVSSDEELRKNAVSVVREKRKVETRQRKGSGSYLCKLCNIMCPSKNAYKKHRKLHKGPFECNICKIIYDTMYGFSKHMNIHSGNELYKCEECDLSFPYKHNLASHKRKHQRVRMEVPYSCYVCKESFLNRTLLLKHNRSVHKNDSYKCDSCEWTFNLFSKLQRHKVEVHGLVSPYDCPICPNVYKNTRCLRRHLRVVHSTGIKNQEEAVICDICGKHYPSRLRMLDHRRTVHFKDPNKPKRDRRKNRSEPIQSRNKGEKRPIGKGLYPCENCDKAFSHYQTQQNHIKVFHTKEITYDCKLCGKKLANAATLRNHMNDHSMSKTFKCEFCDRVFSQDYNRRSHIRRIHVLNKVPRKPFKRLALIPLLSSSTGDYSSTMMSQQPHNPQETNLLIENPGSSIPTTIPCKNGQCVESQS